MGLLDDWTWDKGSLLPRRKNTFEKYGKKIAGTIIGGAIGGTVLNAATKKDNTSSQGAKEKEIDRS